MCILTPDMVQNVIEKHTTHNTTFTTVDILEAIYNLTFLFDMHVQKITIKKKNYYIIGCVKRHGIDGKPQIS